MDGTSGGGYVARNESWTHGSRDYWPRQGNTFYGRHSMGEGLKADEARDATFLLTGAGTWVGKSAYLTADPMTLQEGRRAVAQAISDHRVKPRGLGHPK